MIAFGHPPSEVWDYTPRRIAGFLKLAYRRMARQAAHTLSIQTLAARGDPKDVKRHLKELNRE